MIGVSFAMTADAFADRSKTETRRFWKPRHAAKFQPGTIFMGWTKDPRAGGQRIHTARVLACYREPLADMSNYSFRAEGGTRYWKDRAAYIEAMGGPRKIPYVLAFEHLKDAVAIQDANGRTVTMLAPPADAECGWKGPLITDVAHAAFALIRVFATKPTIPLADDPNHVDEFDHGYRAAKLDTAEAAQMFLDRFGDSSTGHKGTASEPVGTTMVTMPLD